jgi:hypothetical protein
MSVAERALRTGQSGHKDKFKGLARNNVGLPLPAIHQVTAVDDQFGTHSRRAAKQQQQVHKLEKDQKKETQQHSSWPCPGSRVHRSPWSKVQAAFWNPTGAGTSSERDRQTMDRHCPPRTAGPGPDH